VSRRRAQVELHAVLSAIGDDSGDELDRRVLDAAESLLRSSGLRRWSVDDVADRARVGRTSVYRRFGGRDAMVHAVLARELRATLGAISRAAAEVDDLESKAVAAVSAALHALDGSVVDSLLRSDPATFLPFVTTDAGPLLAIARAAITAQVGAVAVEPPPELAEAAARFGLSFVLTRDTVLPIDDPDALDAAVRRMVRPFLIAFGVPI
jgi:TetR/AcrR family transcriptional regulator, repressor for uid operon